MRDSRLSQRTHRGVCLAALVVTLCGSGHCVSAAAREAAKQQVSGLGIVLRYFDLNKRVEQEEPESAWTELPAAPQAVHPDARIPPNLIARPGAPITLGAPEGGGSAAAVRAASTGHRPVEQPQEVLSGFRQGSLYLGLFVGVLFSSMIHHYGGGKRLSLRVNAATALTAAVITAMTIPLAYQNLQPSLDAPFIVQFGVFVQSGVFWHSILTSVPKLAAARGEGRP